MNWKNFGIGVVSGLIAGFILALFTAPKSGKETRNLIKNKALEVGDAIKTKVRRVKETKE